jgi:Spy/CpxP family protein refolding chaperone
MASERRHGMMARHIEGARFMHAWLGVLAVFISSIAWGQHQHPVEPSAYVDMQERNIKALSDEQIDALRAGRGMSLALPAELNGYPGPLHTLQLAERLHLTPQQKQNTEALFRQMQSEARALGTQVIEAEAALDRLFAESKADAGKVREASARAAHLSGELRSVHLQYHIAMRDLLTPQQIAQYVKLRGYAPSQR